MPRIRHIGGHGSILTAKGGGRAAYEGAAFQPLVMLPSFSVSVSAPSPMGLYFRPDGLRFYTLTPADDKIHEFRLAKPWRVDSAVYVGNAAIPSLGQGGGLSFKPDGLALYVTDQTAAAAIRQYSLSAAWDISSLSYVGAKAVNVETTSPRGLAFKPDGAKVFMSTQSGNIRGYTLSTPWLISSAGSPETSGSLATGYGLTVSPGGTRVFTEGTNMVNAFTLGTAWSLGGTVTADSPNLGIATPRHLFYREDGKALYSMNTAHFLTQYGGA